VLRSGAVRRLLDLGRPVGLLMCAVLHFVPDAADPAGLVAAYRDALAPGSFLVLSHGTGDARDPLQVQAGVDVYARTATPAVPRTREQVTGLFAGWQLLDPGVVWVSQWRPASSLDPGHDLDVDPSLTIGVDIGSDVGGGGGDDVDRQAQRSGCWAGVAWLPDHEVHGLQSEGLGLKGLSLRGGSRMREKGQR
jgi:hypothetical protein